MGDFSLNGHMTAQQYAQRMSNATGISESQRKESLPVEDVVMPDIEIGDVSPKNKKVPLLTKKGKLVIAAIVVIGALYFIWKKHKEGSEKPTEEPSVPTTQPTTVEKTNELAQNVSNEQGTEGVDLA